MNIRPITTEDIDQFWELFDTIAKAKKYFQYTSAPPKQGLYKYVERVVTNSLPLYVVEQEDILVGWAEALGITRSPNCSHNGSFAIALLEECRGKGLGLKLAETCIQQARNVGLKYLRAEVFSHNYRAINLYKKLGFIESGEYRDYYDIDSMHSIKFMTLAL